jgi:hypothetical protein
MLKKVLNNLRQVNLVREVFPYIEYLLVLEPDADYQTSLVEIVYRKIFKIKKGEEPSMVVKLERVKDWLPPFLKPKFNWLLVKGNKWYKYHLVFARAERFSDTLAFEYSILNMYYVRYSNACKNMAKATYVNKPAAMTAFKSARAQLLGHIVKRKRWSWNKLAWVSAAYNGVKCQEIGEALQDSEYGISSWLLRYFEDMNKQFLDMVNKLSDEDQDCEEIFKNGEGWSAILYNVAEKGVFGDFNKVAFEPLHKIVNYLNINKKEAKEMIRKIKENQKK